MSTFQSVGLCIKVHDPFVLGHSYLYTLDQQVQSYSHVHSAYGGFDTATLAITGSVQQLEEWYERGIGRHIEVFDNRLMKIWEGFVDQVDLTIGGLSASVGPLTEVGNRVSAVFSRLNTAVNPPTSGGREVTIIGENLISQGLYGIWEKTLSAGSTTSADAEYARDTFLAERAYPARTQTLASGSNTPSISLSLKGYRYYLAAFIYSQLVSSGTQSATAQLSAVIAADPNAIFSTDLSRIDTNAALIPSYEDDESFGDGVIKNILALGDASANRWLFGVYEDRRVYYQQAPTTLEYVQSLQSTDLAVRLISGERLYPWNVRPGKWLFLDDFLIGRSAPVDLKTDPRCIFVESVTYTAPYDVSITGGKSEKLEQVIAQLATGGYF